ncbi:unnamed protein product [Ectocarpus fasciculatus]
MYLEFVLKLVPGASLRKERMLDEKKQLAVAKIGYTRSNHSHYRVPLQDAGSDRMTPSDWPKPAPTRPWPSFRRVHPISATHPPEGYPICFPLPENDENG